MDAVRWRDQGHFFSATAEALRRILADQARRKMAKKRGGGRRFEITETDRVVISVPDTFLTVNEALDRLDADNSAAASVARMRLFAGLSVEKTAVALNISHATPFREFSCSRRTLSAALSREKDSLNY